MPPDSSIGGIGRLVIGFGAVLIVVGLVLIFVDRTGFFGRFPGDILIRRRGWSLWFPITTSIILSILLTIILNLWRRH